MNLPYLVKYLKCWTQDYFAFKRKSRRFFFLKKPGYDNRHPGRDFLIITTGPSMKEYKNLVRRFIESRDLVVVGCNFLDGLCVPQYHIITNRKRFCTFAHSVPPESIFLLPRHFPPWLVKNVIGDRYYEEVMYKDKYFADRGSLVIDRKGIIRADGGTSAMIALGVAVVMGARNVYFAGLDGFSMYPPEDIHFFKDSDSIPFDRRLMQEKNTLDMLDQMNEVLRERGGEIRILTPTVHKKYYAPEILKKI
jgi:hypothetical protein